MGRQVVALALDGLITFDLACAVQVFAPAGLDTGFELTVCGIDAGRVDTLDGFDVTVDNDLTALEDAEFVIVPGRFPAPPPTKVVDALRAAATTGAVLASICTGAFVLAEAGLLDHRRATTHWALADYFRQLYPLVELNPAALFIDDGDILTSAGLSAGFDLCLHIVRREVGAEAAAEIARWNVMSPRREGSQAQCLATTWEPTIQHGPLTATLDWAVAHVADDLSVAVLAKHAMMSERTFNRKFSSQVGQPPKQWLTSLRVQRARQLLETTDLTVERVAEQSGFGSVTALRTHLQRDTGATPATYRRLRKH